MDHRPADASIVIMSGRIHIVLLRRETSALLLLLLLLLVLAADVGKSLPTENATKWPGAADIDLPTEQHIIKCVFEDQVAQPTTSATYKLVKQLYAGFNSSNETLELLGTSTAYTNVHVCKPGQLTTSQTNHHVVIKWDSLKCSGVRFIIRVAEIGGNQLKFQSNLCNSSEIRLAIGQENNFSTYNVTVQSAIVIDDGSIVYSSPVSTQFSVCPREELPAISSMSGAVFPDGTATFEWKLAESVWPISHFNVSLCQGNGTCVYRNDNETKTVFNGLDNQEYLLDIVATSATLACGKQLGRPYRAQINGQAIISTIGVQCSRDAKKFFTTLSWHVLPKYLLRLGSKPFQVKYNYYNNTGELHEVTAPVMLPRDKLCDLETGRCRLILNNRIRLNKGYEFSIVATDKRNIGYYSCHTPREDCRLRPRVPRTYGHLIDKTGEFPSKVANPQIQRLFQIERDSFASTDGDIIEAMVLIGAPEVMNHISKYNIYSYPTYSPDAALLPLRVTSPRWNIFSAWRDLNEHYKDSELNCQWHYGSVHSGVALCVLGMKYWCSKADVDQEGCNIILQRDTLYGAILRGCTKAGCNDTEMAFIHTGNMPPSTTKKPSLVDPAKYSAWLAVQSMMFLLIFGGSAIMIVIVFLLKWSEK